MLDPICEFLMDTIFFLVVYVLLPGESKPPHAPLTCIVRINISLTSISETNHHNAIFNLKIILDFDSMKSNMSANL